jgi:Sulphur transport
MTVGVATAGFALAFICAVLMGYAIQRGATCTVAAVSQLVRERKSSRFTALAEAALWVAGGLLIARALGLLPALPAAHAVTTASVIGGMLLGIGAYLNRACVFGTVANIGARNWPYLLTPIGFLAGAWASVQLHAPTPPTLPAAPAALVAAPAAAGAAFALFALWRIVRTLAPGEGTLASRIWAPHAATVVIGITFVIMFVAAGAWAYTDLLAEFAVGMPGDLWTRAILLVALLAGSMLSGAMVKRSAPARFTPSGYARSFGGGAAMGAGSLLIPGGNDGLILIGMPLLQAHAWVGITAMCLTIAVAILVEQKFARAYAA